MTQPRLARPHNAKLGPFIHSWSLPAGEQYSCPGETGICRSRCYAKKGRMAGPHVVESYLRNFAFCQTDEFVTWMVSSLVVKYVRVMRVHVSGDFFDVPYIRKWQQIVAKRRQTHFFAYTRSWRDDELLPDLIRLAQHDNFSMWWSIDRATGPAPLIRGVRRAYMAIDDVDAANAPDDCDLVFRDKTGTVMKRANGVLVCPPENGVKLSPKITCTRCGICWDKGRMSNWETEILPLIHRGGFGEINVT